MTQQRDEKGRIAVGGRPVGARNKSALSKAQKLADKESINSVKMWRSIMLKDPDGCAEFGIDSNTIRISHQLAAAKELKSLSSAGYKVIEDDAAKRGKQKSAVTTTTTTTSDGRKVVRGSNGMVFSTVAGAVK